MADLAMGRDEVREAVRRRYATAATGGGGCCGPASCGCGEGDEAAFGSGLYGLEDREGAPAGAAQASLGCGNPTAVAELHEGEVVLDLGSGGGLDVLLSARRVGPSGRAYGLDMTDEMLALAQANAARAGVANVEWLRGLIEAIPLPDASVDAVISNCVINLSPEKERVFLEVARVLRPGGRIAIADILADPDMDERTRQDTEAWTGCIAGALTRGELERLLTAAGLREIEVTETHRVHPHAGSAIIRAVKPTVADPAPRAGAAG
jgi:arsenite methyltransferase